MPASPSFQLTTSGQTTEPMSVINASSHSLLSNQTSTIRSSQNRVHESLLPAHNSRMAKKNFYSGQSTSLKSSMYEHYPSNDNLGKFHHFINFQFYRS